MIIVKVHKDIFVAAGSCLMVGPGDQVRVLPGEVLDSRNLNVREVSREETPPPPLAVEALPPVRPEVPRGLIKRDMGIVNNMRRHSADDRELARELLLEQLKLHGPLLASKLLELVGAPKKHTEGDNHRQYDLYYDQLRTAVEVGQVMRVNVGKGSSRNTWLYFLPDDPRGKTLEMPR